MFIQRVRRGTGECGACHREDAPGLTLELGLSAHGVTSWLRGLQLRLDLHWCDACRAKVTA